MQTKFKITNINCGACVKLSESALKDIAGVQTVSVDQNGDVTIESDSPISQEEIKSALADVDKTVLF